MKLRGCEGSLVRIDIFVMVSSKDLEKLNELLVSLKKNWHPRQVSIIHLFVHNPDIGTVKNLLKSANIANAKVKIYDREKIPNTQNMESHVSQRVLKIWAPIFSEADLIWILDCDFLLTKKICEDDFFNDKNELIHYYSKFTKNTDTRWLKDSEKTLGSRIQFNYMIDGWYIFPRNAMLDLLNKIESNLKEVCENFSEFYIISEFLNQTRYQDIIKFDENIADSPAQFMNQNPNTGELKLDDYEKFSEESSLIIKVFWSHWDECTQVMHYLNNPTKKSHVALRDYVKELDKKRFRIYKEILDNSIQEMLKLFSYSDGWIFNEIYFKSPILLDILKSIELLPSASATLWMNMFDQRIWIKSQKLLRMVAKLNIFGLKMQYLYKFHTDIVENETGRKLFGRIKQV
jgi:Family of unknown function (DUF6492)